ncbi:hypothetical protein B484DRAFT_441874 [Ochromonadaceae sp. CCMP2298]|nr:hypothetical protein B484DRAFT_441874 [Ochromonadaceae sp. CCMP2298]
MIDLTDEDERVEFRHKASSKGAEGELLVTSIKLVFQPAGGGPITQLTWPNIAAVKYSPQSDKKARAMVLVTPVIKGDGDLVVHLTDPSVNKKFAELERLKVIVGRIRKAKGPPAKLDGNVGVKRAAPEDSGGSQGDALLLKKRKQLLAADKALARQYRDLVEVTKVLADEDFWASHEDRLQEAEEVGGWKRGGGGDGGGGGRGRQNFLLGDTFSKDATGAVVIDLTPDMKRNIFAMYPEVRRAFEEEVGRSSETDFWQAYFQCEYYTGRGGGGNAREAVADSGHRDDLFARYLDADSGTQAQSRSGPQPRLAGVDAEMDLTSSFGDYRPREALDPADENMTAANALVSRYNTNSFLVMGSDAAGNKAAGQISFEGGSRGVEIKELEERVQPSFVPISVHRRDKHPAAAVKVEGSGAGEAAVVVPSAFGVSAGRAAQLRSPTSRKTALQSLRARLATSAGVVASLETCFPTGEKAGDFFKADLKKLRKGSQRPATALSSGATGSRVGPPASSGDVVDLTDGAGFEQQVGSSAHAGALSMLGIEASRLAEVVPEKREDEDALLDPNFKQELLEMFTAVTELLRHFYASLNKASREESSARSSASTKAEALLDRLVEQCGRDVEARKRSVAAAGDKDKSHAVLAALNGILILIQKAKMNWSIFQS